MLLNNIEMTTATTTTGALTLQSVSGALAIDLVYSQTRFIHYAVLEWPTAAWVGPPSKFEYGVGECDMGTLVLTRSKPTTTYDGTTYKRSAITSLAFSGVTSRVRVVIAPSADFTPFVYPFLCVASPAEDLGCPSGHLAIGSGTLTLTNNRECYIPHRIDTCGPVTQAGIVVTTGVASGGIKLALYEIGEDGLPGRRLNDWNSTPFDCTSTGNKVITLSTSLLTYPMWVYVGLIANSATIAVRGANSTLAASPAGVANSGQTIAYFYKAGTYSSGMPTPAAAGLNVVSNGIAPVVYLRADN